MSTTAVPATEPAPLPVELLRFDARLDDRTVHLSWTTATETGNAEFRVQRTAEVAKSHSENGAAGGGVADCRHSR